MGHRLTKIYTRTGDNGTTGLGDGSRVPKDSLRIAALGDVDELNSLIGLVLSESVGDTVSNCLQLVQHDLFDLGGDLSIPGRSSLSEDQIKALEIQIDVFNKDLPPLVEFVLPGGSRPSALCHVARTVCRRAERSLIRLTKVESLSPLHTRYLNRLSDLLFVLARVLNQDQDIPMWRGAKPHS
jgi:cob(I)alamin adenosyltransferase